MFGVVVLVHDGIIIKVFLLQKTELTVWAVSIH